MFTEDMTCSECGFEYDVVGYRYSGTRYEPPEIEWGNLDCPECGFENEVQ